MAADITDKFTEATNGTRPVPTTLTAIKAVAAPSISCGALTGWPTATAVHFIIYTVDTSGKKVAGSQTDWKGIVSGSTITNLTLKAGTDNGYSVGAVVEAAPTAAWADDVVEGIAVDHTQLGYHKTLRDLNGNEMLEFNPVASAVNQLKTSNAATGNSPILEAAGDDTNVGMIIRGKGSGELDIRMPWQGWINNMLPAVSSITYNGNNSYTVVYASSVASLLSNGMRLLFNKTVAGNANMSGIFNGTSQYFTKTSPTGTLGTITDNFTIMGWAVPTAIPNTQTIAARMDATAANGLWLRQEADGRISCGVLNGGVSNYRYFQTNQSIPINKKVHVAATWATGSCVIYIDGIAVPLAPVITSGTAPTTAGTGGDFSVGRYGAYTVNSYWSGYLSNVAVFSAVLSQAIIRQYSTIKLLGSETNCIGAWSLDNTTVNQQNPGTNDLTAQGGVGYTALSPHGTLASTIDTLKAVGIVMDVATTTVVVQVPNGCTLPASGGISSSSYSTVANPYSWVIDKGRWAITSEIAFRFTGLLVSGTTYNHASYQISIPAGQFNVDTSVTLYTAASGAVQINTDSDLSTTAAATPSTHSQFRHLGDYTAAVAEKAMKFSKSGFISQSVMTIYYFNVQTNVGSGSITANQIFGDRERCMLRAIPAGI